MPDPAILETLRSYVRRIDPSDASAHNNLGVFYHRRGMVEEARGAFQRALILDPELDLARRNLSVLDGEGGVTTMIAAGSAMTARALLRRISRGGMTDRSWRATSLREAAEASQAEGRVAEAIASYRHALALNPGDATARLNLAVLLAARNAFTAALQPLLELLDDDPYNVPALAALGAVLEGLDRLPDATVAFSRVMRFDPHHEEAVAFFRRRASLARNQN